MVQRPFNYAIVDEVDSILIDEARTPLIISGPAEDSSELYRRADTVIPRLSADAYEKDEKNRTVVFTEAGIEQVEEILRSDGLLPEGISLYAPTQVTRAAPRHPGAARPQAVRPRRRLHRQGRPGRHHRRVHRPHDGGPPLFRGPAPGARGQGACRDPAREPDARLDHLPEPVPHVSQARRHDRHGDDRGGRVRRDLPARGGRDPDQRAGHAQGRRRRDLPHARPTRRAPSSS